MNLFYINIDEFKKTHNKAFLEKYQDIEIKSEKRFFEYTIGRYLVKKVGYEFYKIENTEIIINNSKPEFKNSDIKFNLSHSKNFVVCVFDKNLCSVDIQFMKDVNLSDFEHYFKRSFENKIEFYKFWTQKEAQIKLNSKTYYFYTEIFKKEYMLTIGSANKIEKENIKYKKID